MRDLSIKDFNLTPRLSLVASFVKKNSIVADIGTDHAMLPIFLIKNGFAKKVYATEISTYSYKRAKENIAASGLQNGIDVLLCDGLKAVPNDYDTIVLAGMGGELIAEIIEKGKPKNSVALILQPMTSSVKLRRFLYENGYVIEDEALIKERRRLYSVIHAVKGFEKKTTYNEFEVHIPKSMSCADKTLYEEYLNKTIKKHITMIDGFKIAGNEYKEQAEYSLKIINDLQNLKTDLSRHQF